jgi:hypothetical protein
MVLSSSIVIFKKIFFQISHSMKQFICGSLAFASALATCHWLSRTKITEDRQGTSLHVASIPFGVMLATYWVTSQIM